MADTIDTVRHVSITIERPLATVYAFAAEPANVPRWAQGLASTIERHGDVWLADSPMGTIKVRFTPRNELGVLDHDVTLPSGQTVHNPMRVLPRDARRSEVVFTLFRRAEMTDAEFAADANAVKRDLLALKQALEPA